jgi:hypothetical protein
MRNGFRPWIRAIGRVDWWKNQRSKISWHCPFNKYLKERGNTKTFQGITFQLSESAKSFLKILKFLKFWRKFGLPYVVAIYDKKIQHSLYVRVYCISICRLVKGTRYFHPCFFPSANLSKYVALLFNMIRIIAHLKNVPGLTKWKRQKVSSRDVWLDPLAGYIAGFSKRRILSRG